MMRFLIRVITVKNNRLEIIILFKAQTDNRRRFYGTLRSPVDAEGNLIVIGRIRVLNGFILAQAAFQNELGERLDEFVLIDLDYDIHIKLATDIIVSLN